MYKLMDKYDYQATINPQDQPWMFIIYVNAILIISYMNENYYHYDVQFL